MSRLRSLAALTALSAATIVACAAGAEPADTRTNDAGTLPPTPTVEAGTTAKMTDFQLASDLRATWLDSAQWIHLYAIAATTNEGAAQAMARATAASTDFATVAAAFLGDGTSEVLAKTFQARETVVREFVTAAETGDAKEIAAATQAWELDTDAIAGFFSRKLYGAHAISALGLELRAEDAALREEILARANGDAKAEIAASDEAETQAIAVGQTVATSLIGTYRSSIARSDVSQEQQSLALELQPLLADRAFWLRIALIDQSHKTPSQPELDRAMASQVAVADTFQRFFGKDVVGQVQLGLHNLVADADAYALAQGDATATAGVRAQWVSHANAFAKYLASLNARWQAPVLERILGVDVDRTAASIDARAAREWDADAADWAMIFDNGRGFAGVLAAGLVATLPRPH